MILVIVLCLGIIAIGWLIIDAAREAHSEKGGQPVKKHTSKKKGGKGC